MLRSGSVVVTVAILTLFAAPSSVVAQATTIPFELNSLEATYPLVGAMRGSYRIEGDSLVVLIDRGLMGSNVPTNLGPVGVLYELSLRSGIGEVSEGGWRVATTGTELTVADSLTMETAVEFSNLRFAIPLEPGKDLGERWLFFGLRGRHQGLFDLAPGRFSSYVCDELNLLGATPESEERAARMRERYSEAC